MANCQKCGVDIPHNEVHVRRINTGSVGGMKVESNAFVCKTCAEGVDTWKKIVTAFWALLFLFLLCNSGNEKAANNTPQTPQATQGR